MFSNFLKVYDKKYALEDTLEDAVKDIFKETTLSLKGQSLSRESDAGCRTSFDVFLLLAGPVW